MSTATASRSIIADDSGSYELHPDGSLTETDEDGSSRTWASAKGRASDLYDGACGMLTPLRVRLIKWILGGAD